MSNPRIGALVGLVDGNDFFGQAVARPEDPECTPRHLALQLTQILWKFPNLDAIPTILESPWITLDAGMDEGAKGSLGSVDPDFVEVVRNIGVRRRRNGEGHVYEGAIAYDGDLVLAGVESVYAYAIHGSNSSNCTYVDVYRSPMSPNSHGFLHYLFTVADTYSEDEVLEFALEAEDGWQTR